MRRIGIVGGLAMLAFGLVAAIASRGLMPDGIGALDDIDWHGVQGIGA